MPPPLGKSTLRGASMNYRFPNRELSIKGNEISKDEAIELADLAHTLRLRAGDVFDQLKALGGVS